jgi:hypothetical protein
MSWIDESVSPFEACQAFMKNSIISTIKIKMHMQKLSNLERITYEEICDLYRSASIVGAGVAQSV